MDELVGLKYFTRFYKYHYLHSHYMYIVIVYDVSMDIWGSGMNKILVNKLLTSISIKMQ